MWENKFLGGLWKAWTAIRHHLLLDPADSPLPTHWRLADIANSLHPFLVISNTEKITLLSTMSKLGASTMDLWDVGSSTPRLYEEKFRRLWGLSLEMEELAKQFISTIQSTEGLSYAPEPDPDNWFWSNGNLRVRNFVLPKKTTYTLLLPPSKAWEVANKRWDRNDSKEN